MLAAHGGDAAGLQVVKAALMIGGDKVRIVSTRLGELQGAGGGSVTLDDMRVAMPSINFNAVFVAGGAASVAALKASGDAVLFVREAYKHAKAISALGVGCRLAGHRQRGGPGGFATRRGVRR